MNYRNWSITKQITYFSLALTILVFGIISSVSYFSSSNVLKEKAIDSMNEQMQSNAALIELQYVSLLNLARRNADILRAMYPGNFHKPDRSVKIYSTQTPSLVHESAQINATKSKVDRFSNLTGGTATIFVKDGDDFLRISTSLKKADGSRALVTYLGQSHPGYQTLIKGETYEGYAKLFGKDYMTVYRPIKNETGDVIGILYIGFDITESITELQKTINNLVVEESGFYMLVRNSDKRLISHPRFKVGEALTPDILNGLDANKVLGQHFNYEYLNNQQKTMFANSINIPGWNWTLIGLTEAAELNNESLQLLYITAGVAALGIILISGLLAMLQVKALAPLQKLQQQLQLLGRGDLSQQFEVTDPNSNNEIDLITASAADMSTNLKDLIDSLQHSVESLESQAQKAQDMARLNGDESESLMMQTNQIATAIEEMSASIRDVANHSNEGATKSQQVDESSRSGHQQLTEVVESLDLLKTQLNESQANIENVSKESEAINQVTEVINSIAEQTNLLALNAAIEAARAGEQGRGFAVVADEVRSLAQRTQSSISEISKTIAQLQSQVKNTAQQMEDSHKLGTFSAEQGTQSSQQLSQITVSIGELATFTSSIASATEQQSAVADEITRNLHQISTLANEGQERAGETVEVADGLTELASELKTKINFFKV
ncbi:MULTISPECIES: methyl-accepting chemotaxis protein [unclassified Shewanella]|uniref:methyl-accepting chemotaxis protein n=1 Tax=unclassified Shewanella TaxID=196818 RepID=UPI003551B481